MRILVFNHDKLENAMTYDGNNTYAGISFEFIDLLPKEKMNEKGIILLKKSYFYNLNIKQKKEK